MSDTAPQPHGHPGDGHTEQATPEPPTVDEFARLLFAPGRNTITVEQAGKYTKQDDEAARAFFGLTESE